MAARTARGTAGRGGVEPIDGEFLRHATAVRGVLEMATIDLRGAADALTRSGPGLLGDPTVARAVADIERAIGGLCMAHGSVDDMGAIYAIR